MARRCQHQNEKDCYCANNVLHRCKYSKKSVIRSPPYQVNFGARSTLQTYSQYLMIGKTLVNISPSIIISHHIVKFIIFHLCYTLHQNAHGQNILVPNLVGDNKLVLLHLLVHCIFVLRFVQRLLLMKYRHQEFPGLNLYDTQSQNIVYQSHRYQLYA